MNQYVPPTQPNMAESYGYNSTNEFQPAPTQSSASIEGAEVTESIQVPKDSVTLDELGGITHAGKPHNVTVTRPTVNNEKANVYDTVTLPSASMVSQRDLIKSFPNLKGVRNEADVVWGQTFLQAPTMAPADDALDSCLSRENSDWRQGIEVNGDVIRSSVPRFKMPSGAKVEGERALQMAFSHMQLGDIFHVGLWNSGFWVSFKPAPDPVWMAINRLLGQQVMGIDRNTYGLLHSSATALAVSTIIDMILPYVYSTSIDASDISVEQIPQYLSNLDEHDFIWGFIAANYPRGFNLERSCIADASKCRYVIKETLNVRELQLVDNFALPEFHKNHMRSRGTGSMKLSSVLEYQKRLSDANDSVVTLKSTSGSEAQLLLAVPSSAKKSIMSDNYVTDIQESVLKIVTNDSPVSQRGPLYDEYMTATEMRLYQHWVKEIRIDENVVDKEEDIAAILAGWTRDTDLRIQFFEAIGKFIERNTLSVIGLEAAVCPNCGANHSHPAQKVRGGIDYIPLDIIQLFSNLAEFKARLVEARS